MASTWVSSSIGSARDVSQYVRTQSRESLTLLPVVRRKPRIARHWLLSAHAAFLALVIVLIATPTVLTAASDRLMQELFPSTTGGKFLGMFKRDDGNPRLDRAQTIGRSMLWTTGGSLVLLLLWLHLPEAVRQARRRALDLSREADELTGREPTRSVVNYYAALEWSTDHELEQQIRNKIADLDQRIGRERSDEQRAHGATREGTVVLEPGPAPAGGTRTGLDRYTITDEIGRGAMGIVHRGVDLTLDRSVALKQLAPALVRDPGVAQRFSQEARALARLSHANIVQVYDLIAAGDQLWIVMELVEGEGLDRYLAREGQIGASAAIHFARQMANGLACAHDAGIVHRDFKPANVLVSRDRRVKIMDFGIAKLAGSSVATQIGTVLGTPAYMSPEQASGRECDIRTDIYALGITLYRMVSGDVPFKGDTRAVLAQHLTQEPASLSSVVEGIDRRFSETVARMLLKDPEQRPRSMHHVAELMEGSD
jgi:tRNA A-37 threonylcarbamoyl transferase component Bud32